MRWKSGLLPGSESTCATCLPFLVTRQHGSSRSDAGGKLKKIRRRRRPAADLVRFAVVPVGGSWNRDGDIIVGQLDGGLMRVRNPAASPRGSPSARSGTEGRVPPAAVVSAGWTSFRRTCGCHRARRRRAAATSASLDAKPEEQAHEADAVCRRFDLRAGGRFRARTPAVHARGNAPGAAVRSDTARARRQRRAGRGACRLASGTAVSFRPPPTTVLIYRTVDADFQLAWFDRQGALSGRVSEAGGFGGAALSPMGCARSRPVPIRRTRRRPTCGCSTCRAAARRSGSPSAHGLAEFPVWSPDGTRIAFTFDKRFVHQRLASGVGGETALLQSVAGGRRHRERLVA